MPGDHNPTGLNSEAAQKTMSSLPILEKCSNWNTLITLGRYKKMLEI